MTTLLREMEMSEVASVGALGALTGVLNMIVGHNALSVVVGQKVQLIATRDIQQGGVIATLPANTDGRLINGMQGGLLVTFRYFFDTKMEMNFLDDEDKWAIVWQE